MTPAARALPPTCAQGGVCAPGDIGPGGGLVFYVSSTPFKCGPNNADDCLYLEAAPKSWGGGATDPSYYWNKDFYEVDGISRDGSPNMGADQFGLGYKNSRLMAALDSSETNSAVAALGYTGGGKNDWYLPTIAELGILCQYAYGQTPAAGNSCDYTQTLNTGIPSAYTFSAASYQSSSQSTNLGSAQWHQNFVYAADNNPAQQSTWGYAPDRFPTRPIRAFTTIPTVNDGNVNCGGGGSFAILNKEVVSASNCVGTVVIPYGVTAVGPNVFWQSAITSVSIPNTVRSLGDSSFRQTAMTSVSIPASVETIGFLAFGTTLLTQLTFATNSNLHTIGDYAFQSSVFTSVTIPASVTTLSSTAFQLNNNLTDITFDGVRPSGIPSGWPWSAPAQVLVSAKIACGSVGYFVIQTNSVTSRHNCRGSVVIPEGVTSIGGEAFDTGYGGFGRGDGPSNYEYPTIPTTVTSLTIPNTVTSIGWFAFRGLNARTLTIPNSVTSLGIYTFASAGNLETLTVSSGLTTIPAASFAGMTSLRSLVIPEGITTIEDHAFGGLIALPTLSLPNSLTSVGYESFGYMRSVTSLTLGSGLTTIGDGAFVGALSLTSLTIPDSVTSIGANAFFFDAASNLTTLAIGKRVATIGAGAFAGAAVRQLEIPNSVTSIGNEAFNYLSQLETLTIASSVTTLGTNTFAQSSSITRFNYCGALTNQDFTTAGAGYLFAAQNCGVSAPGAPTSISATLVGTSSANVSFTAPSSNGGAPIASYTAIASPGNIRKTLFQSGSGTILVTGLSSGTDYTFTVVANNWGRSSSASLVSNQIRTPGVPNAPTGVSATLGSAGSVNIAFTAPVNNGGSPILSYTATSTPDGLTGTISQAGSGTISISGLTPGQSYQFSVVATNALGNSSASTASTAITMPNYPGAPTGATAVLTDPTTVSISFTAPSTNGGSTITGYTATSIPDGLTGSISQAGSGTITISGLTAGNIYRFSVVATNSTGDSQEAFTNYLGISFDGVNGAVTCGTSGYFLIVNKRVESNFQCNGSVNIPEGVEVIGEEAFIQGYGITSLNFPSTLVTIEDYAFYSLEDITSLVFPNSLTTIGNQAFRNAYSLETLTFGNGAISIGNYAFRNAESLRTLTIPNNVVSIGTGAFQNLDQLTSLTLGIGVTSISSNAFIGASSLTTLVIPEGVTDIADGAFYGAWNLSSLRIPSSITSLGENVFGSESLLSYQYCGDRNDLDFDLAGLGGYERRSCSSSSQQSSNSNVVPAPRQKSKIADLSISTLTAGVKTVVVISGSFAETVTNISIDGENLPKGAWSQSSTSISLNLPALSAGRYLAQIYNGSAPLLQVLSFVVENAEAPMPTPSITPKPTTSPKPVVTPTPSPKPTTPAPSKTPLATKTITIKCVKGRTVKLIKGIKPKCPVGYTKR